jgi:hypothetical protein
MAGAALSTMAFTILWSKAAATTLHTAWQRISATTTKLSLNAADKYTTLQHRNVVPAYAQFLMKKQECIMEEKKLNFAMSVMGKNMFM